MSVTATVVLCTRKRPGQLAACLLAVNRQSRQPDEILVVDNTVGDPHTRRVAAQFGARYVTETRIGHNAARNTGLLAATSDLIAYTDDDGEPDPDWLLRHIEALVDPSVGATTGRVLPLDVAGEPQPTGEEGDLGVESFRVDATTPGWFERTNFGGVGIGPNMVFRRSLAASGWRFHEGIGLGTPIPGCDEHRAFFDVVRAGFAVSYVPTAIVRHGMTGGGTAQRRRRRILCASVGYATMLAVEEPQHRGDLMRYAGRALSRRGGIHGATRGQPAPRRDWVGIAVACLVGPVLYARARAHMARPLRGK